MAKDDLFIPHGAFLTCDKGAAVMTLQATPKKHNLYALPIATESDHVPLVNIPCFGVCSINGSACMPVAPQWKSVHSGAQKVLGKAPLISTSYCKCQKGGNIKIFLDRKAAEAALADDKKSRVDGIPWLDGAIGNALLGPVGIIVNKAYGSDDVSEGIGRGFRKGLKGTWNFLSDDMWKADTWKGMGKMAAVGVVGYGGIITPGYGPTQRLQDFDKTFGTDLNQTHEAIGNAISSTWDEKVVNGTAGERSELAGQTAEMVFEAVIGSKGAGAVAKGSMAGAKMALGAERVAEIAESIAKLRQALKLENLAAKVKGIFKVGSKIEEVPPIGEFNEWYNKLSSKKFDKVWEDAASRRKVEARIRHPGGLHEWLMTSRANVFKRWGVSMDEIKRLRTKIDEVIFKNPPGIHGGPGSTRAHNEILNIIDNSNNYTEFKEKLFDWSDKRLEGGRASLPPGFFD